MLMRDGLVTSPLSVYHRRSYCQSSLDKIMEHTQPLLIVIRGIPGSGKSFVAHALQHELGENNVVMLDPDATDYESDAYRRHVEQQHAEGVEPALHAYRYLRQQAYNAIAAHKIIIWNQPFTNLEIFEKMVARLRTRADECQTQLPILVVEVEAGQTLAKQRVTERMAAGGHGPSDATLQRRFNEYETFAGKGYQVVSVQGDDAVSTSVSRVLQAVHSVAA